MTLRTRLVLAVLALVALGLTAAGAAGVYALRDYLVDRTDGQLNKMVEGLRDEVDDVRSFGPENLDGRVPRDAVFQVIDDGGQVLTTVPEGSAAPVLPADARPGGGPFTAGQWRVVLVRVPGGTLLVGQSLAEVQREVEKLITADLLVGGIVLVILAGVAVLIVRGSLRPLVEIEETAEAIAAGRLSERVPDRRPGTEVGRLTAALNGMLSQIETAFRARTSSEEQMRRFVADAGHELRTPLTAIRGFAQVSRQGERDVSELAGIIARIEDVAGRMSVLVDDLLLLARLDQLRPLERRPVDLLELAADAVTEARVLAPDREITLTVRGDAAYQVTGDRTRLRQVIGNLVGNALTHTPPDTPVRLALSASDGSAVLEVADRGPGLAPEQASRVFERFYRADAARSRDGGGSGLGLAIVAALVAAHGGAVVLDTAPGRGCTFRVTLPLTG